MVGLPSSKGGIHLLTDLKLGWECRKASRRVNAPLQTVSKKLAELKVKKIVSLAVSLSMKLSALRIQSAEDIDSYVPPS